MRCNKVCAHLRSSMNRKDRLMALTRTHTHTHTHTHTQTNIRTIRYYKQRSYNREDRHNN
jgi:hypothetical protein